MSATVEIWKFIEALVIKLCDPNVQRKTCFDTESDLLIQHSHIAWNIKWEMIVTENILKNWHIRPFLKIRRVTGSAGVKWKILYLDIAVQKNFSQTSIARPKVRLLKMQCLPNEKELKKVEEGSLCLHFLKFCYFWLKKV